MRADCRSHREQTVGKTEASEVLYSQLAKRILREIAKIELRGQVRFYQGERLFKGAAVSPLVVADAGASRLRKFVRTIHLAVREVFRLAGMPTNGRTLKGIRRVGGSTRLRPTCLWSALAGREPAVKGVMIYANSGGYDNLALVRFSQLPLENRHQLFWTRHFGFSH